MGINRQVWRSLAVALIAGVSMLLLVLVSMISVPLSRQDVLDPIFGLLGPLGGLLTS